MSAGAAVISNAGPLMVLAKLNLLHLLKSLYGRVHFSRSVYTETVIEGMRQGYEDAYRLEDFFRVENWIPQEIDLETLATDLREAHLDAGERDTLGLALASSDALVLMDESAGREIARKHSVRVRGSLGVLVEAHQRGLIGPEQLRAYFAEMARREDIWVSRALVERVLGEVFADQV